MRRSWDDCGGGTFWRPACKSASCPTCGTFVLDRLPPQTCTCESTPVGGMMYLCKLDEKCPDHGRCLCNDWVDTGDDYQRLRYSGKCNLRYHKENAGRLAG